MYILYPWKNLELFIKRVKETSGGNESISRAGWEDVINKTAVLR
jgi:hypothetical protein